MKKKTIKKQLATCEEAQLVLMAENLFLRNQLELAKSEADILSFVAQLLAKENKTLRAKLEKSIGKGKGAFPAVSATPVSPFDAVTPLKISAWKSEW